MKVSGKDGVFFADDASNVLPRPPREHSLTVNRSNVLASDSTVTWDIGPGRGASQPLSRLALSNASSIHRMGDAINEVAPAYRRES